MAQFTTANLTNERVLVKGTDQFGTEGQTVLDASEWNEVKAHQSQAHAVEGFDAAVEEFFAPLMKAIDEVASTQQKKIDPITYVVIHEGTEAQQGRDEVAVKLGTDSIVLRLIELGDYDRLVWVDSQLEVLEVMDFDGTDVPAEDDPFA